MLALVNNEPKTLDILTEMLDVLHLDHQEDVVTRRTKYELKQGGGTCSHLSRDC